jgi:diadenosine tetraphosphate (Ap4A) HIT family hydrolase
MKVTECPFCKADAEEMVIQNKLWFAWWSKYPVSPGHLLLITFRHIASYFDATQHEKQRLIQILDEAKHLLDEKHHPDGYNIGINVGEAAGQTVMHLHVHLIPRYRGDVSHHEGGVRGVIPSKQQYVSRYELPSFQNFKAS